MKVEQTGDRTWRVAGTLPSGQRVRRTIKADTPAEAFAEASRIVAGADPIAPINQTGPTLRDALQAASRHRWRSLKSGREAERIAWSLGEKIGLSHPLDRVTPGVLYELRTDILATGVSASTANRRLAYLQGALSTARDMGLMHTVPSIKNLKEAEGRTLVVSEELQAHIHTLSRSQDARVARIATFALFLLDTGLRLREAIDLQPHQWDADAKTVVVEVTKSGKPRTVPVGTFYDLDGVPARDPRWTARRGHNAVGPAFYQDWKLLGLPDGYTPHVMRHTCATMLWQKTGDLYLVKTWLGHADISTTQRYAHARPRDLMAVRDIANGINL